MIRIILSSCAALTVLFVTGAASAAPLASPWAEHAVVQARLISGASALGESGAVALGLHIELEDGWKTYWRTPGDSGLPPKFDWSASENLAAVDVAWPAPDRFDAPGDSTLGYDREVVFPLKVKAADPARPLDLSLSLDYAVCEEVCVPVHAELTLHVPAGTPIPTVHAQLIDRFAAQVPRTITDMSAVSVTAVIDADADAKERRVAALRIEPRGPSDIRSPRVIVEGPRDVSFGVPQREGGAFVVPVKGRGAATLRGREVTVILAGSNTAIEQVCPVE